MKRTSYISDVLSHALVEVGVGARAEYIVGRVCTFHKTQAHRQSAHVEFLVGSTIEDLMNFFWLAGENLKFDRF